jgi:hypothetical protein
MLPTNLIAKRLYLWLQFLGGLIVCFHPYITWYSPNSKPCYTLGALGPCFLLTKISFGYETKVQLMWCKNLVMDKNNNNIQFVKILKK